jgi:hypothetical protein
MASHKFLKPPIACEELTSTLKKNGEFTFANRIKNHGSLVINQFFCELLFCFDVDDFASQRKIAISCLPDETQERFHSDKFGCSVSLHFLVACSLADPFA